MDNLSNLEYALEMRRLKCCRDKALLLGDYEEVERLKDKAYELGFGEYIRCVRKHEQFREDLLKESNVNRMFDLFESKSKYSEIIEGYACLLNSLAEQSIGGNIHLV